MNIRPVVYFSMKTIEEKIVVSSSQIKQEAGFDKSGL